ncbi:MAG: amidohydrolase family protein [Azospirillaceae bacterium]
MPQTTLIRNADWIVAWNQQTGRHEYSQGADVAFSDGRIDFVGKDWRGEAERVIEGKGLAVLPGLVNLHCHPALEPFFRGIREDHGVPEMHMTGLYERGQAFRPDVEDMAAAAEVAYCELLLSGTTSVCDQMWPWPGWFDLIARSGLRGFVAPGFASARWKMTARHRLEYSWDESKGRRDFAAALDLLDEAGRHPSGRLSGVVFPLQIDTCTEELLRDVVAVAEERDLPVTTHASQSVIEFQEMVRRHGLSPVQWAHRIGILGRRMTLGHAIFLDSHSWLHHWTRDDIGIMAETGTSVAHCPSPFARYGHALEDFGRYVEAGINMGVGTDVAPHNLIEEMRLAIVLARVAGGDIRAAGPATLLHAATVGGADALLRPDLGRLAAGACADLVLVDLNHPLMRPARDPVRTLIWSGADRAVRDVFIDGEQVVADRTVVHLDHGAALDRLTEAQARMVRDVPARDYLGRQAEEVVPLSLPRAGSNTGGGRDERI